jgi:hypothetical protein
MSRKRLTTAEIIEMGCEADVALAPGVAVGEIWRALEVPGQGDYRSRRECGEMEPANPREGHPSQIWMTVFFRYTEGLATPAPVPGLAECRCGPVLPFAWITQAVTP